MTNFFYVIIIILAIQCLIFFIFYTLLKQKFSPTTILSTIREEINSLITELNAETERDVVLLEDKMNELKKMLSDVDKKILLLNTESLKKQKEHVFFNELDENPVAVYTKKELIQKKQVIEPEYSITEQVLRFAKKGFSEEYIAKELSVPLGEVVLILDLNTSST